MKKIFSIFTIFLFLFSMGFVLAEEKETITTNTIMYDEQATPPFFRIVPLAFTSEIKTGTLDSSQFESVTTLAPLVYEGGAHIAGRVCEVGEIIAPFFSDANGNFLGFIFSDGYIKEFENDRIRFSEYEWAFNELESRRRVNYNPLSKYFMRGAPEGITFYGYTCYKNLQANALPEVNPSVKITRTDFTRTNSALIEATLSDFRTASNIRIGWELNGQRIYVGSITEKFSIQVDESVTSLNTQNSVRPFVEHNNRMIYGEPVSFTLSSGATQPTQPVQTQPSGDRLSVSLSDIRVNGDSGRVTLVQGEFFDVTGVLTIRGDCKDCVVETGTRFNEYVRPFSIISSSTGACGDALTVGAKFTASNTNVQFRLTDKVALPEGRYRIDVRVFDSCYDPVARTGGNQLARGYYEVVVLPEPVEPVEPIEPIEPDVIQDVLMCGWCQDGVLRTEEYNECPEYAVHLSEDRSLVCDSTKSGTNEPLTRAEVVQRCQLNSQESFCELVCVSELNSFRFEYSGVADEGSIVDYTNCVDERNNDALIVVSLIVFVILIVVGLVMLPRLAGKKGKKRR